MITVLTHEKQNLKTMLNGAGTLMEKSISALGYITKNYTEAPALEYIIDVPSLHADLSEEQVVETIVDAYRNNTLVAFLGKS